MQGYNGADVVRMEITKKLVLLNRIEAAMKNVSDDSNEIIVENITLKEMLELLNRTAGDEEFYDSEFEIIWCGFRCKLPYGAVNHNNITDTIEECIEEEGE